MEDFLGTQHGHLTWIPRLFHRNRRGASVISEPFPGWTRHCRASNLRRPALSTGPPASPAPPSPPPPADRLRELGLPHRPSWPSGGGKGALAWLQDSYRRIRAEKAKMVGGHMPPRLWGPRPEFMRVGAESRTGSLGPRPRGHLRLNHHRPPTLVPGPGGKEGSEGLRTPGGVEPASGSSSFLRK